METKLLDINALENACMSALNKLNKEMIFNNQKGKVLQKLLLLHNIFLKRIFCTKKL
jgi:hypothetical protein